MVTDLVRDHISLSELACGTKTSLQVIEKAEVQVYFFIFGAIERASRGLRGAAPGRIRIAIQHEFGVMIRAVFLCRHHLIPVSLDIIQRIGNKLYLRGLALVAQRVRATW